MTKLHLLIEELKLQKEIIDDGQIQISIMAQIQIIILKAIWDKEEVNEAILI